MPSEPATPDRVRVRVWCSQWATCGWAGYRYADPHLPPHRSVSDKPCPKCGKKVVR